MDLPSRQPCPGTPKNGKCVEIIPPMVTSKTIICIGCRRNCPRYSELHPRKRIGSSDAAKLKQEVRYQLNEGLGLKPAHLQGITDAFLIGSVIGVEDEDFIAFRCLVVKAANNKESAQLFDFVDKANGSTLIAIYSQTARF